MATKKVIKKSAPKKAASLKKTVVKKTTVKPAPAPKVVTVPKPEVVDPNIYPIGKMKRPEEFTETVLNKLIQDIRILPEHLKKVWHKNKVWQPPWSGCVQLEFCFQLKKFLIEERF